jgi:hypothetical protein
MDEFDYLFRIKAVEEGTVVTAAALGSRIAGQLLLHTQGALGCVVG